MRLEPVSCGNVPDSLTCEIPLTQGQITIVDVEDFEWLNKFKWHAVYIKKTKTWEAARNCYCRWGDKKIRKIRMSRQIMNAPINMKVDHRNHDTLNNRRCNLRVCTHSQNMMNRKPNLNHQFKGFCWIKKLKKWRASIRLNHKPITIGYFDSEVEAARAYDVRAKKLFGEFALTNHQMGLI